MELNRKNIYLIVFGILLTSSAIIIYYNQLQNSDTETEYGDISIEEAKTIIVSKPNLVILDVRTQEEYDDSHIEDALLIPISELEDRLDELSEDEELLVYCRTGNRSSSAINILTRNGFTKVFHMNDGITGWIQAGYPTVK